MAAKRSDGRWPRRALRGLAFLLVAFIGVTVLWWAAGRITADGRRLQVRSWRQAPITIPDTATRIRIVTWNIAHGRGDVGPGLVRNFRGGSPEERGARLARIASVLERADADVVVLNEVDFASTWSGGVNQAEVLARAAGYGRWVEQRNYDLRFPFATFSFGNALLTRLPVEGASWVGIPPHSRLEALAAGGKGASAVRVETRAGPITVVPVHLEYRSGETRRGAVPALDSLRAREAAPVILAGDFNSAPAGWPGAEGRTALGELLEMGWTSARAERGPSPGEWSFPTYDPDRAIDWVLVEPPLTVLEARVLAGPWELSDHAPVLAVVRVGRKAPPSGP
ncbi:MAG TPA: endonuclease/exonuclease/phosphatase family protein [Longimicrobiales bacterium]|nr:endonuclease/exonuclease/phosphatase family protein [Longimicrobiales bacterium]